MFPPLEFLLALSQLPSLSLASQFPPPSDVSALLSGALDLHIHSAPDAFARSLSDLQAAQMAKACGLRAIVLKNHFSSTAGRAALVREAVPGIDVFGGIALNHAVGGLNPAAVEAMARFSPATGKVVWFPTLDARAHQLAMNTGLPGISVLENGSLSPATLAILDLILTHDLVLATGHLGPEETLALVRHAARLGIRRIWVNHPLNDPPGLSPGQLHELVAAGAKLEFTYLNFLSGPQSHLPFLHPNPHIPIATMVQTLRSLGCEHAFISSDLGQSGNPIPTDGLRHFLQLLLAAGLTPEELKSLVQTNPAGLLY